jgi:Na+-transporting methylmalonyl-CoA/oxaloacetate decarboxylase gamma subunit
MKRTGVLVLFLALLILQTVAVSAMTADEAKQAWEEAKQVSKDAQKIHQDAKITWAADKTPENDQAVVDTGKTVLNDALDEAEAWLIWKNLEAEENNDVPEELKNAVKDDVDANLAKIDALRTDVSGVKNQFELGVVFLKMIGKYFELLADVARDSGKMWVHIGNTYADTTEEYEEKLRTAAEGMPDNEDIIQKLDTAKSELETARRNIDNAASSYEQVRLPGTPLLKFAEGNSYLRAAQANLILSQGYLNQAYNAMAMR